MLSVNFQIDKVYLAYKAIVSEISGDGDETFIKGQEPRDRLGRFKEFAAAQDQLACDFLKASDRFFDIMVLANHTGIAAAALAQRAEDLLQALPFAAQFQPVLADTEKALNDLKAEWLANYDKSRSIVEDITGIKFDKTVDVFVTREYLASKTKHDIFAFNLQAVKSEAARVELGKTKAGDRK